MVRTCHHRDKNRNSQGGTHRRFFPRQETHSVSKEDTNWHIKSIPQKSRLSAGAEQETTPVQAPSSTERGQTSFSSTRECPELSRYPRTRTRPPAKRYFGYAIPASSSRARAYLEEGLSQSFEGGFPFFSVLFLTQDAQGCAVVCRRHKEKR